MSGGGSLRPLYDLLIYWALALVSGIIGKPIRCPPLLFYLVLGAVVGNLNWVEGGEGVNFFAEWAITIVFFSLGFEETVEHFMEGIRKSWGIALIGALVPFGCGYLCAIIFWPSAGWYVHLTIATAVTATAVSLTMMVLQSVGLLKSRAAMGIMTSAVLDDVGCLILVSILIPVVVAAKGPKATEIAATHTVNVTGSLELNGTGFHDIENSFYHQRGIRDALSLDLATATTNFGVLDRDVSTSISFEALNSSVPSMKMNFTVETIYSHSAAVFDSLNKSSNTNNIEWLRNVIGFYNSTTKATTVDMEFVSGSVQPYVPEPASSDGVDGLLILWIIAKVIIFFIIVAFLHNVVLPNDVTEGPISKIPGVRTYGMKHILSLGNGDQVPLIVVTFGLGLGMVGAALGFHPAIGAYFAGLILEESYFELEPPKKKHSKAPSSGPADEQVSVEAVDANAPIESITAAELEQLAQDEADETKNTMEHAMEAVGSASFMWLGPVFFVHLGANLEIEVDLLAKGIPQALGIMAILWVGQFISATLSAKYVPGGFTWTESALIGFGMLGRAELYFVVLNEAKKEGIFNNDIFFPMAVAALFMNVSLPISMSLFKPLYIKYTPVEPSPPTSPTAASETAEFPELQFGTKSSIVRRGIGMGGVEMGENGSIEARPATRTPSRLVHRSPSDRQGSRLASRPNSKIVKRNRNQTDVDMSIFDPVPNPYAEES